MTVIVTLAVVKACTSMDSGRTNKEATANSYESEWQSPNNDELLKVGRILVKNKIHGCGEYYIKKRISDDTEILIACTSDGKEFKYYLAWLNTEKILGLTDDGIESPANKP